jgi:predicted lipid-binding transport protein (Tim44 family)
MKKLFAVCLVSLISFGLSVSDADAAKRFGGGQSIGKQRQMQPVEPRRAPDAPAAAPQPAPAQGGSKWLGPLAGLAAGGLLGALFFGGAFDGIKMMDVLVIALLAGAVFFVLRAMRRPRPEAAQYAGLGSSEPVPVPTPMNAGAAPVAELPRAPVSLPPGFDVAGFVRSARISFMRLQGANDRKDLADVRDYTTPEMFAEISRHFAARGDAPQRTEVHPLEVELMGVTTEGATAWASARFTGRLRDVVSGESEDFEEIWHVSKDMADPNAVWLIAGIRQVA